MRVLSQHEILHLDSLYLPDSLGTDKQHITVLHIQFLLEFLRNLISVVSFIPRRYQPVWHLIQLLIDLIIHHVELRICSELLDQLLWTQVVLFDECLELADL